MSGVSEPIYAYPRELEELAGTLADQTVTRVEDALLGCLKSLWDDNEPDLEHGDNDYGMAVGARTAIAQIAKDFDLHDELAEHDATAKDYA